MIFFDSDYTMGAHEQILARLCETNMEQTKTYGEDAYCRQAAEIIRKLCGTEDADVHFMVGGTQTNLTVISAALRPHHCVICAETGHINVHETGAIESCGHKIAVLPSPDGRITADQVKKYCEMHEQDEAKEHIAKPKLVYISNPTELGTIYTKKELYALHQVCREKGLYLFMDGARLGYALCSEKNDLTFKEIAECCDTFYIGGTKCGALFGEAVVVMHPALKEDFRYIMKQKGAMLAKGRLLGIQFLVLLQDGLYFTLGKHAVKYAGMIKDKFIRLGYQLFTDSSTNQLFVSLPDELLQKLGSRYTYSYYKRKDDANSIVRFCTSWAVKEEDVLQLLEDLEKYTKNSH